MFQIIKKCLCYGIIHMDDVQPWKEDFQLSDGSYLCHSLHCMFTLLHKTRPPMMILVCRTRHGNICDRILGSTHRAYPGMAPDWIHGLSVPEFPKHLKDKVSGQEAMKFG